MEELSALLVRHGYAVIFGWVLAEQLGLPAPAAPFLLAAGALAGTGQLSAGLLLLAASVASLISDSVWYGIGRLGGARVLGWLCRIALRPDSCVSRTQRTFGAHGAPSLLVAKFIPGFNTVAPPLAGIIRMPLARFVVFTGLGGVIWAGAWLGLGWLFAHQLELIAAEMARLGRGAGAVLVLALAAHIGWKYIDRRRFLRRIRIARITPEDLKRQLDTGAEVLILDVRDRLDVEADPASIPGAFHVSVEQLEERHGEIPRERDIIVYCT
jgi:membrane protein DedA with SNARE-associated domain